jgi:Asp-tRNA(Asn)/Glu-tRNA(Gln) amidotransferase C subunit
MQSFGKRHASISRQADEKRNRAESMKYYTTFIRKVNEFNVNNHNAKRAKFKIRQDEPTQWQKYKLYMNMLEEDDGTFPRVSELSIRLEQEQMFQESK